jgi:radical SAM protein with 4Fe4S-binding SPASM domain
MFSILHLELTSRCNKSCPMCGRRRMEREYPHLVDWGDMDHDMVHKIAVQVPSGTIVQLHNNGDPTCYPYLGWALFRFKHCFRQFNTNGKLLPEKAGEIIDNLDMLTISVIENDIEGDYQYERVKEFLAIKGDHRPSMVYRLLGKVDKPERWRGLPGICCTRVLHAPGGSYDYERQVTIPEVGVCLDLLTHLAIDRYGNISVCVRFDPHGKLRLGNVNDISLFDAWKHPKRLAYIQKHIDQQRDKCPGCAECHYWGVPRGAD